MLRTRNRIQKPGRGGFRQSPHRTDRICILSSYVLDSSSRDSLVQADILHTHLYISSNLASLKEELPHKSGSAVPYRAATTAPVPPVSIPAALIPAVPVLNVPVPAAPIHTAPIPAVPVPHVPVPAALIPTVRSLTCRSLPRCSLPYRFLRRRSPLYGRTP